MSTRRGFLLSSVALAAGTGLPRLSWAAANMIQIGIGEEPSTIDQSASWTGVDYQIAENYAEYLIQRTPEGELKPGLASAWTVSPDGKVIEFKLRQNVMFHSGDPLTAQDVLFSYARGRSKSATVRTRLSSVEKIEAIGDDTIRVTLRQPDVTFVPNRGAVMIVSKAYHDRVGEERFSREPAGTGPYHLTHYVLGDQLELRRFDGYWGTHPQIEAARFFFVPEDTARLAKLRAGEVDMINACPYSSVRYLERSKRFSIVKLPVDHPTMSVVFGLQNPRMPWHDRRVRLAMAYAVDTQAIVKNVLSGFPDEWQFLAPHELGYDPSLKPYPFDPIKAKSLMTQAGYADGFDMKLYYAMTGRVQMNSEVAEALSAYFGAVGIRTQLIGEEWLAYRARYDAARKPGSEYVALFTHGRAGSPDPTYNLTLFFSKRGSISIYDNPQLENLIDQAKATVDDSRRGQLIQQAVNLIEADVPSFPIYNNVTIYAMRNGVTFKPTLHYNLDLTLVKDMAFV